jgi:hypothetical protein
MFQATVPLKEFVTRYCSIRLRDSIPVNEVAYTMDSDFLVQQQKRRWF